MSPEAIEEFKEIYQAQYGVNLTTEQALDLGTKLVRLVKIIIGSKLPN